MGRYHLDPKKLAVVSCADLTCAAYPESAHYYSRKDAEEAVELLRGFSALYTSTPRGLDFCALKSAKSDSVYLEAMVMTPFGEEVFFTVEDFHDHAVGSMFIAGKEYILARKEGYVDLAMLTETAKDSLKEARQRYRADIWPEASVIDLYNMLERHSTANELVAPTIQLSEVPKADHPQLFVGETINGTEVLLRVAYGYAVAEVVTDAGREIVHESNIAHQLFVSERERNVFAAKAFGALLATGSI